MFIVVTYNVNAGIDFSREVSCYEAMGGLVWGGNYQFNVGGVNTILVPAEREGKWGLYGYTNNNSVHYWAPWANQKEDYKTYHIEMKINKKSLSVFYRHDLEKPRNPTIGGNPDGKKREKLGKKREKLKLKGGDFYSDESRSVFHTELEKRIKSLKTTYDERASRGDVGMPRLEPPEIKEYIAALKKCSLVPELKEAVNTELGKFPSQKQEQKQEQAPQQPVSSPQ